MQQLTNQAILSVSQINNQVKFSLHENFSNVWIKGEVASLKTYPSGHTYLTLKDESSEISAVIFNQFANKINKMPSIGLEVIVMGVLSIYEPRGQFQLQIKSLHLTGDGELWLAYEKLKKKLELEGVFSIERKKKLPKFSAKIGIITSSEGAALRDILQIINRRSPHLICYLYPVSVQGKRAAQEIADAIEIMNNLNEVDLLIVGRGGGSMEDLWSFNEEMVVRAIFNSKLPIISAVGHETDTTLSDYAADLRAPTPSAAAELASVSKNELLQTLDYFQERLMICIKVNIMKYFEKVNILEKRHGFYKPNLILETWKNRLLEKYNLMMYVVERKLNDKINTFDLVNDKLNLLNPQAQLKRGYALAMNKEGEVIYDIKDVGVDDEIKLKLAIGQLEAKVLKKGNNNGK